MKLMKVHRQKCELEVTYMLVLAVDTIQSATRVTTSTPELS